MDIQSYLNNIRSLAQSGQATEHSYRPALERLFKSIDENLTVINEPKRLVDVGAVDFVFNRRGIAFGWCEAKDLFKDIQKFKSGDYSKEQKERYKKGFPNLIYTNGTDFEFIVKGEVTGFVSIADMIPTLPARSQEFPRLEMLLKDFASQTPISINTAKQLAEMMAGKAGLIKDRIGRSLLADTEASENTDLVGQFQAFKTHLINDITINDFADIYAETIAYGLFAARLHDTESPDTFDRAEALELLPKSNPFLRSLFVYIAGPNLDDRLRGIIDDLCQVFKACDVPALMQDFGKWSARNDPFLHFYETFLAEYNPAKRKARGVWYTPEPVVNFIVRAVDDVLKTEFGLPMGLADTSKVSIDWDSGQNDLKTGKRITTKRDVHRVQILDPATGTGTFLAETIKQIAAQVKDVAPAMWSSYVERDLIPRLHGFELLMASYAMCHMKLDMMLTDMGYKPSANPPRLNVFLTNSLEEGEKLEQNLFGLARDITEEGRKASEIKNDMPIMCVIGNPPYNKSTMNKGPWITQLVACYKDDLDEQSVNSLSQDEIKFLRFAEHYIEKLGYGIVGMVVNNSFLDGVTHRIMRKHLLETFDQIHVINLHGDSNKGEQNPDGSPDKNVFDIKQGVTVVLMLKNIAGKSASCKIKYRSLYGNRESKYERLWTENINDNNASLDPSEPYHFFVPKDMTGIVQYESGFDLKSLFLSYGTGVKFRKDNLLIRKHFEPDSVAEMISDMHSLDDQPLRQKWDFSETTDWVIGQKRQLFRANDVGAVQKVMYRPLDVRYTYYPLDRVSELIPRGDSRKALMVHNLRGPNFALLSGRQNKSGSISHFFVTSLMSEMKTAERTIQSTHFPLYLYPEEGTLETERRVNFDPKIYAEIKAKAGLQPSPPLGGEGRTAQPDGERGESADGGAYAHPSGIAHGSGPLSPSPSPPEGGEGSLPDELRVFDYIYGVLHAPDYRATYAQFLKIDFPRIPYPTSPEVFAHVAQKGGALRRLHLMEEAAIGDTPFPFVGDGDTVVGKPVFAPLPQAGGVRGGSEPEASLETSPSQAHPQPLPQAGEEYGRVHINPDQYFDNVPRIAWEFHIGGYQPAQKWLKDRKGRALSFDDVVHYQKIIKILSETDRIMRDIRLPLP
ncbi:type ISP restriction/modification enzyme [Sphingorhabdus sp.]|jgi:hypothetical protein|uniref:type ISP restriction/modification enzyme n=1 Tax=Sphingorhabdus sp. TaxID=1902408 RepID=UPI0037C7AA56